MNSYDNRLALTLLQHGVVIAKGSLIVVLKAVVAPSVLVVIQYILYELDFNNGITICVEPPEATPI